MDHVSRDKLRSLMGHPHLLFSGSDSNSFTYTKNHRLASGLVENFGTTSWNSHLSLGNFS